MIHSICTYENWTILTCFALCCCVCSRMYRADDPLYNLRRLYTHREFGAVAAKAANQRLYHRNSAVFLSIARSTRFFFHTAIIPPSTSLARCIVSSAAGSRSMHNERERTECGRGSRSNCWCFHLTKRGRTRGRMFHLCSRGSDCEETNLWQRSALVRQEERRQKASCCSWRRWRWWLGNVVNRDNRDISITSVLVI